MKLKYLPVEDRQNLRVLRHTKDKQVIIAILESIFRRSYYTLQTLWEYRKWFYELTDEELREHTSLACGLIQIHIHAAEIQKAKELLATLPDGSIYKVTSRLLIPGITYNEVREVIGSLKEHNWEVRGLTLTAGRPTIRNGIWDMTALHNEILNNKEEMLEIFRILFPGSEHYIYDIVRAETLYQMNDCYNSLILVIGTIPHLKEKEHLRILFAALTLQMYNMIMNGQSSAASMMEDLKKQLHHAELDEYLPNIDALEAWAAMYDGDYATVTRWMRDGAPDENKNFCMLNLFRYMIKLRAYIATERYMAVTALASKLLPLLTESKRYMDTCELYLLWSISDLADGRRERALDNFGLALELAERNRYDRLIADEGKRAHELLLLYKKERGGSAYVDSLIKLSESIAAIHPKYLKIQSTDLPPLTETEKKVVRLIAAGYSNAEISDTLGIAVDTVKQHCKHIFAKLDVNNRTAAASTAAELGIIDPPFVNKPSNNTTFN